LSCKFEMGHLGHFQALPVAKTIVS